MGTFRRYLGHYIGQSPWDCREVMRRVASRAHRVLQRSAWLIDDHARPLRASHRRRALSALPRARPAPVPVGVAVHAVSARGSLPLYWRLFLPKV
ncbi:transposase [Streptomyces sp. E11-3]|uniref:transposase n=1 Tax=Streptomyces sp. E11-3 TaxID=3110112 RepID=UPI00397F5206